MIFPSTISIHFYLLLSITENVSVDFFCRSQVPVLVPEHAIVDDHWDDYPTSPRSPAMTKSLPALELSLRWLHPERQKSATGIATLVPGAMQIYATIRI